MKILLDTHVFLWIANEPERLSQRASDLIVKPDSERFVSMVSIWELALKEDAGKLKLDTGLDRLVKGVCKDAKLKILPLESSHIFGLKKLPTIHRDPFDRLIVSQAVAEKMALVSTDKVLDEYPARVIW